MNYFPLYLKLDNKKILIIGGGKIATDKLKKILPFTSNITVVSNDFTQDMESLAKSNRVKLIKKKYKKGMINQFDIVISAIDNITLQKEIFYESRDKNILVNSVDLQECCDFIFPSYIKEEELIISISTSGISPAIAKYLKRFIQKVLPKDLKDFLKEMKDLRNSLSKGKQRMDILEKKAEEFFKKN